MGDADARTTVVLDCGTGLCKAGLSGHDEPSHVFMNVIGSLKHPPVCAMYFDMNPEFYFGEEAEAKGAVLKLVYPITRGVINYWDAMEKIWHHTFYNKLQVEADDHPVLLTEPSFNPKAKRERATQIMFETFNSPAMFIANQAVLSLYATGRTTGVVLDSGHSGTRAVPVYKGHVISRAVVTMNLGGEEITQYLKQNLADELGKYGSSGQQAVLRDVKERLCYVAQDFDAEMTVAAQSSFVGETYVLPDESQITLKSDLFKGPEALFQPALIGLDCLGAHEQLYDSIMKCDVDIHKELFENIVLAGGNTMFNGTAARIAKEMNLLVEGKKAVKVDAPEWREYAAWIGGSMLASQPTFETIWITREEYNETGPTVAHAKCF